MEYSCFICAEELLPAKELVDSIATNTVTCCSKCGQTFHTTCVQANNRETCPRCNFKNMKKNAINVCFWVRSFEEAFWISVEGLKAPITLKDKMKELDSKIGSFDHFGSEVISFAQEEEAAMDEHGFAQQEYSYDKERTRSARYMVQKHDSICAFVNLAIEQADYINGKSKLVKKQESETDADANPQNEPSESSDSQEVENREKSFTKPIIKEFACRLCQWHLFAQEPDIMPAPSCLEFFAVNKITCHNSCGYVFHDLCLNKNPGRGRLTCPHCQQLISKNSKVKLIFQPTPIKDFERPVPESFTGKMGAIKKYLTHLKDLYLDVGQKPPENNVIRQKNKKAKEEIFKRLGQRYKEFNTIMNESKTQAEALDRELAVAGNHDKPDDDHSPCEEQVKPEKQVEAAASKNAVTSASSSKDLKGLKNQDKAADSEKATPSTSGKRPAESKEPNIEGKSDNSINGLRRSKRNRIK